MGIYYKIVNPAKRQYIDAASFNSEVKASGLFYGMHGMAVAFLLCHTDELRADRRRDLGPLAGAWSGDRVIVAGDYCEAGLHGVVSEVDPSRNLYFIAADEYENISYRAMGMLIQAHLEIAEDMATWAATDESALLHFGHATTLLLNDAEYLAAGQLLAEAIAAQVGANWQAHVKAAREANPSWQP